MLDTRRSGDCKSRRNSRQILKAHFFGSNCDLKWTGLPENYQNEEYEGRSGLVEVARGVKGRLSRSNSILSSIPRVRPSIGHFNYSQNDSKLSLVPEYGRPESEDTDRLIEQIKEKASSDRLAALQHLAKPVDEDMHVDACMSPIRRSSLLTPGIATRGMNDILKKPPSPQWQVSQAEQEYYFNPHLAESSPLSRLAALDASNQDRLSPVSRTSTPSGLSYSHLEGLKRGTLRITNGEDCPVRSDCHEKTIRTPNYYALEDYFTDTWQRKVQQSSSDPVAVMTELRSQSLGTISSPESSSPRLSRSSSVSSLSPGIPCRASEIAYDSKLEDKVSSITSTYSTQLPMSFDLVPRDPPESHHCSGDDRLQFNTMIKGTTTEGSVTSERIVRLPSWNFPPIDMKTPHSDGSHTDGQHSAYLAEQVPEVISLSEPKASSTESVDECKVSDRASMAITPSTMTSGDHSLVTSLQSSNTSNEYLSSGFGIPNLTSSPSASSASTTRHAMHRKPVPTSKCKVSTSHVVVKDEIVTKQPSISPVQTSQAREYARSGPLALASGMADIIDSLSPSKPQAASLKQKLRQSNPLSQPPRGKLPAATILPKVGELIIPPVPVEIATRHAERVEQFPPLRHTYPSPQHVDLNSPDIPEPYLISVKFPTPAPLVGEAATRSHAKSQHGIHFFEGALTSHPVELVEGGNSRNIQQSNNSYAYQPVPKNHDVTCTTVNPDNVLKSLDGTSCGDLRPAKRTTIDHIEPSSFEELKLRSHGHTTTLELSDQSIANSAHMQSRTRTSGSSKGRFASLDNRGVKSSKMLKTKIHRIEIPPVPQLPQFVSNPMTAEDKRNSKHPQVPQGTSLDSQTRVSYPQVPHGFTHYVDYQIVNEPRKKIRPISMTIQVPPLPAPSTVEDTEERTTTITSHSSLQSFELSRHSRWNQLMASTADAGRRDEAFVTDQRNGYTWASNKEELSERRRHGSQDPVATSGTSRPDATPSSATRLIDISRPALTPKAIGNLAPTISIESPHPLPRFQTHYRRSGVVDFQSFRKSGSSSEISTSRQSSVVDHELPLESITTPSQRPGMRDPFMKQRPLESQRFSNLHPGRYEGGLSFGYEPGFGLGGSAGTRAMRTGASRKSVEVSQGYGLDLSDVPIFVAPSP